MIELSSSDADALRAEGERLPRRGVRALTTMQNRIAEDFRQRRTVTIGQITFSRTEASVFVAAAHASQI